MNPTDIIFITRGTGWGHTVRDLLIAEQLLLLNPMLKITFASYGDGLNAYNHSDATSIVELSDPLNHYQDCEEELIRLFHNDSPRLIVSDEMIIAEDIARKCSIPCVFITNYYDASELRSVHSPIIFTEFEDLINQKGENDHLIYVTGPVFKKKLLDRPVLSEKESAETIPQAVLLLGGSQSNLVTIENLWLLDRIFQVNVPDLKWIVIGDEYQKYFPAQCNVSWQSRDMKYLFPFSAVSFVISRGGINTLWELACAGIGGISVPYSRSVNINEYSYSSCMAKRGLSTMCTYEDIRNGWLEKWISYYSQYGKSEGCLRKAKTRIYLKNNPTLEAAKVIYEYYNGKNDSKAGL